MDNQFKGLDFNTNTLPDLTFFDKKEIESKEIMSDLHKNKESIDFDKKNCDKCNSKIDGSFNWFYLISKSINKNLVICCYDCLKNLYNENGTLDDYEIYQYSRCTAYYKCKELGNLRDKCQISENLSYTNTLSPLSSFNFCETAQAGIILASYKQYEIMNKFSKETNHNLASFNSMLKQFDIESSKQFKINLRLTILVIILTVVNLVIASIGYISDRGNHNLLNISKTLYNIESKINNNTIIKSIDEVKKDIKNDEILKNKSIEEINMKILQLEKIIDTNNKENKKSFSSKNIKTKN